MAFDLKITFGGLCMLVQKEKRPDDADEGLYVLMPDASGHGVAHCRMMITPPAKFAGNDRVMPLTQRFEDLRSLAPSGPAVPRPETVLAYSKYATKVVNPDCFGGNPPNSLGYRIALPLGSKITPRGEVGQLNVPGETVARPFVGLVDVEFHVPSQDALQINGKALHPDSDHRIFLMLLNVPFSELYDERLGAEQGVGVGHLAAYYGLLALNGLNTIPIITHAETKKPTVTCCRACPTCEQDTPRPVDWWEKGVDPNNCTIAWGCAASPCP
jgi:hypothetical protein